jgi:hypothetical protein
VFDTISASVTGARHLRVGRNGQDAAVARLTERGALAVVCDGCSSGAYSEVGARLGANLVAGAIERAIDEGAALGDAATWATVRAHVLGALSTYAVHLGGDRERAVFEHLLFTVVAAAVRGDETVVWAIGDGAYALGDTMHQLGPFEGNAPPYLAYDLTARESNVLYDVTGEREELLVVAPAGVSTIAVATDGVCDVAGGLVPLTARRYIEHPDALRRQLAVLAKPRERIDWCEQRVVREPAALQDDCAIAIIRRRAS